MGYWAHHGGEMSKENPYGMFLGDQEPVKVIAATCRKIEAILEDLGPERMDQQPAAGKWSAREIVCHLADCELVFAFRLRQTLAEDDHVIQPFDQQLWSAQYGSYDGRLALTTFCAVRKWNLALLGSLPATAHAKPVTHPERGAMTFWSIVETMGGHDINHLGQLEAIAKHFAPVHSSSHQNA
jgi:uncharacterized damage-inducible protein DinB